MTSRTYYTTRFAPGSTELVARNQPGTDELIYYQIDQPTHRGANRDEPTAAQRRTVRIGAAFETLRSRLLFAGSPQLY